MKGIAIHRFCTVTRTRLGRTYVTELHIGDEKCVNPMAVVTIATKSAPWRVRGYNYVATHMIAFPDGEPRPHRCVRVILNWSPPSAKCSANATLQPLPLKYAQISGVICIYMSPMRN